MGKELPELEKEWVILKEYVAPQIKKGEVDIVIIPFSKDGICQHTYRRLREMYVNFLEAKTKETISVSKIESFMVAVWSPDLEVSATFVPICFFTYKIEGLPANCLHCTDVVIATSFDYDVFVVLFGKAIRDFAKLTDEFKNIEVIDMNLSNREVDGCEIVPSSYSGDLMMKSSDNPNQWPIEDEIIKTCYFDRNADTMRAFKFGLIDQYNLNRITLKLIRDRIIEVPLFSKWVKAAQELAKKTSPGVFDDMLLSFLKKFLAVNNRGILLLTNVENNNHNDGVIIFETQKFTDALEIVDHAFVDSKEFNKSGLLARAAFLLGYLNCHDRATHSSSLRDKLAVRMIDNIPASAEHHNTFVRIKPEDISAFIHAGFKAIGKVVEI